MKLNDIIDKAPCPGYALYIFPEAFEVGDYVWAFPEWIKVTRIEWDMEKTKIFLESKFQKFSMDASDWKEVLVWRQNENSLTKPKTMLE